MNTSYVYQGAQVGEFRNSLLWAAGPASYTPFTAPGVGGDIVYNPGANEYINFPSECTSLSGNYKVRFVPTSVGYNQVRAGAPSPSQSGWTAVWEYTGASDNPLADTGSPLTLGTLSAAATQSTFTSNGVLTVATTTPPPVNSFVVLSNGTSGAGIIFNGSMGQVVSVVAGTSYTINFGAMKSLNYTVATDTLKYQVVQVTPTNLLQVGTPVTVTSVAVASNVLTVVCAGLVTPGTIGVIQGLVAGEVPQGAIVQVLGGSTSTGFTANIIAANLSATSGETATFTPIVTNGNAPLTVDVANTITGSTVAATATISTAAGKITVLPVAQSYVPGQLFIVQGLTHGSALNGGIFQVLAAGLTGSNVAANGYIATAVTTGTADLGSAAPLIAGYPPDGAQVASGTNLSAELIQFGVFESQL
jgi:hypothetical protein